MNGIETRIFSTMAIACLSINVPVSASDAVIKREVDPLNDEVYIYLIDQAVETSSGYGGELFFRCHKDGLRFYIDLKNHIHNDMFIDADYRFAKKPPVEDEIFNYNLRNGQTYKNIIYSPPMFRELIKERTLYIRYETGVSANFSLEDDDKAIQSFIDQCRELSLSFQKAFKKYPKGLSVGR